MAASSVRKRPAGALVKKRASPKAKPKARAVRGAPAKVCRRPAGSDVAQSCRRPAGSDAVVSNHKQPEQKGKAWQELAITALVARGTGSASAQSLNVNTAGCDRPVTRSANCVAAPSASSTALVAVPNAPRAPLLAIQNYQASRPNANSTALAVYSPRPSARPTEGTALAVYSPRPSPRSTEVVDLTKGGSGPSPLADRRAGSPVDVARRNWRGEPVVAVGSGSRGLRAESESQQRRRVSSGADGSCEEAQTRVSRQRLFRQADDAPLETRTQCRDERVRRLSNGKTVVVETVTIQKVTYLPDER